MNINYGLGRGDKDSVKLGKLCGKNWISNEVPVAVHVDGGAGLGVARFGRQLQRWRQRIAARSVAWRKRRHYRLENKSDQQRSTTAINPFV